MRIVVALRALPPAGSAETQQTLFSWALGTE
jgi:hypothetical protein